MSANRCQKQNQWYLVFFNEFRACPEFVWLWYLCLSQRKRFRCWSQTKKNCENLSTVWVSELRPQYDPRKWRIKCMCIRCKSTWEKKIRAQPSVSKNRFSFFSNEQNHSLSSRSKLNGSWRPLPVNHTSLVGRNSGVSVKVCLNTKKKKIEEYFGVFFCRSLTQKSHARRCTGNMRQRRGAGEKRREPYWHSSFNEADCGLHTFLDFCRRLPEFL
jgi:hypothetical protein